MDKLKLLFGVLILFGCISCEDEDNNNGYANSNNENIVDEAFETAKQIFYSLPSPVETAMIIENTETEFSEEYILPLNAADLYETTTEQAISLGVYSADLSYLTMFNQTQFSLEYMGVCKKLAEDMGIMNVIDDEVLNEIQEKLKNRDEVMNIISEQFMKINAYLEENQRSVSATLIVFGGWVEGLYLSVMLVGEDVDNNPQLIQMIYDQHISLKDLIDLLSLYKDNEEVKPFLVEITELNEIYNSIDTPMSQYNFEQIKSKIELIRNSFTKISF